MKRIFQAMVERKWPIALMLLTFVVSSVFLGQRINGISHAADDEPAIFTFYDDVGAVVNLGAKYELRHATANFTVTGAQAGSITWSVPENSALKITGGEHDMTVYVQVTGLEDTMLLCRFMDTAGNSQEIAIPISIVFSINEFLVSPAARMTKIHEEDTRCSIVMDYDTTLTLGTSAAEHPEYLNLIFGDATSTNAEWSSSNADVIAYVDQGENGKSIRAMGAGRARLNVRYMDGTMEYTDSIEVYVRPQIYRSDDSGSEGARIDNEASTKQVEMKNNDRIYVPVRFDANPLESVLNKVTWVIAQGSGENMTLVRDSLGNTGENGDDARLIFDQYTRTFRLNAKAGNYVVMFYVRGIYSSFEDTNPESFAPQNCAAVYFRAQVMSNFEDKGTITINKNGSYNFVDAFNLSLSTLNNSGDFSVESHENDINENKYLNLSNDWVVHGLNQGNGGYYTVKYSDNPTSNIPGLYGGETATVYVNVAQDFFLNTSQIKMFVNQSEELIGLVGDQVIDDTDTFEWSSSDEKGEYVEIEPYGAVSPYRAIIKAKKVTPDGSPVTVTLSWTDEQGVTRAASCIVTVATSISKITLNQTSLEMEVESVQTLSTGLGGDQNLIWISADEDIAKVEPLVGNTQATVTAGKKTGTTIVTVMNTENNVFATCRVTVTAAISDLSIVYEKKKLADGANIDVSLSQGLIFLTTDYTPKNATSTDVKWSTSNADFATVDENGVVTVKQEETVWISVEPVFNPYNIVRRVCINIVKKPVTDIILDTEEIDMIAGDQYTVSATTLPEDATDSTLLWNSDNDKIAKVAGGIITAVGAGDANITVANGTVFKIIKVHVRNRLISISFTQKTYEIKVGDTVALKDAVKFNPSEHVNTNLSWTSTNSEIVSVDKDGNITGLKAGETAWITCVPEDLGVVGAITCTVKVVSQDIPANGVTLNPEQATIYVGENLQIGSIFDPITATYQNLSWSSTDETVAKVDDSGMVTGVSEGKASIGAVYKDPITNTVWDPLYCEITVVTAPVAATSFELTPAHKELYVGDNYTVIPVFTPSNATDQNVTYYSSDERIATIDEKGVVEGIAVGSAVLIGRAEDGAMVSTCTVTVITPPVPVTDFTIEPLQEEVQVGSTFYITPIFTPSDASNQKVTYSSADASVASVNEDGLVTGVEIGKTTIICQSVEGKIIATCNVTVIKAYVDVIGFNIIPVEQTIKIGSTFNITPVFTPSDATNQKVTYQSANTSIASVNENGVVTGLAKGDATIICQSDEGKIVVYCVVHVEYVIEGVTLKLTPDVREIALNKSFVITKTIEPAEADPTSTWVSSDPKIAKVSKNGKVKGLKKGKCTITCTLNAYDVSATCKVTVATLRTTVKLSKSKIRMGTGTTYKLGASIWSNNTKIPALKWMTTKKKIASVSQNGKIKAKKPGNVTITAVSRDRNRVRALCKVKVIQRASSLRIDPNYVTCYVGGSKKLTAIVKPNNTTTKAVTWESEDESIATVESNGRIRGIAEGETRIKATTTDGSKKTATCFVKITEHVPISSIVVAQSDLTMKQGDSAKLSYTVLPNDASDEVKFASDNKRVAKVSANGTVTATGTGNCTITILSDGGISSTVSVNVVALNQSSLSLRQYDTETLTVDGLADGAEVSWYSSNPHVATVDGGTVTGRSIGSTYIYATVNGCKMACRVSVTKI